MSLTLIMAALILASISGLTGLAFPRTSHGSQKTAVGFMVAAALIGLAGAGWALVRPQAESMTFPWPAMGNAWIGVDALSAFFLVPIFLMGGLGSVFSLGYWAESRHLRTSRRLQVFWGGLVAGMALLVIGKHALSFLFGWEVMALSAFFLVSLEDHRPECRKAGLIYLIATHIGTLALFGLFVYWRWATGSYGLQPAAQNALSLGVMNGLFLLAMLAFGLKAGIMPFHFWLPGAHTQAPSHVSAMLSGVVLKMGIYGLLRFFSLLPNPPAVWGVLLLVLGAASGLLGVVFALGQHDLKRLLAYHSVENIGIILMGLGLGLLGRSLNHPAWVVLGLAGCLLHVWNHGFFKSLLFFGAGAVVLAAGTRQIDRLGGLARTTPWTAALFLVGAVAICGLPPLNGFVSEWFVFLGCLNAGTSAGGVGAAAMLGAPVLAMIGALAVACFVKVYGAVFLGTARIQAPDRARESPFSMRGPMLALAALCVLIGLAPVWIGPLLDAVIAVAGGPNAAGLTRLSDLVPLPALGALATGLAVAGLVLGGAAALLTRKRRPGVTWDCGYVCPTPRMQYTASSFAQTIVALFAWVLKPRERRPVVSGPFPGPAGLHTHIDEPVLDRCLDPGFRNLEQRFGWFRRFQHGLTQHYIFYILITVMAMLGTLIPFKALWAWLAAR